MEPCSTPYWSELMQYPVAEIAAAAADEWNKGNGWFQRAYAWLYHRLPEEEAMSLRFQPTADPMGPPPEWVPLLAAGNDGRGYIEFVKICDGAVCEQVGADELHQNACHAANFVFNLFRSLDHRLGWPKVEFESDRGGYGTSLSLGVMMAALGRILGIAWPDTVISTGGTTGNRLEPVEDDTLPTKIAVAKRFGYQKLVVVEGQTGVPEDCPLEVMEVSTDPLEAMFSLLSLVPDSEAKDDQLARLLAVYDRRTARNNKLEDVEKLTEPFLAQGSPLVRHVIHDMRSRAALHDGNTLEAAESTKQAEENALAWHDYPTGWLGHYLRYEQTASRAELAVDQGLWEDVYAAHRELDHRLKHLENARDAAFADTDDYFAILALRNTRAQRRQYLGRLKQDVSLFELAWKDFMFLEADWPMLFDYCKKIGRADSTPQRQRNYCLALLADFRRVGKGEDFIADFIQSFAQETFVRNDTYDEVAWLDWQYLLGRQPKESEIEACMARASQSKTWNAFIPYEKILRYAFGTPTQHALAKEKLGKALPHLEKDENSILSVLALRTRAVLELLDDSLPPRTPDTPLTCLVTELLRQPGILETRCPY